MASFNMFDSKSSTFSTAISGSPVITSEKLRGASNYKSWAASVHLWFKGQGYLDHLTKSETEIADEDRPKWVKVDAQLCSLLWHSLDPKLLSMYQAYDTCYNVWNKAASVYGNDIQRYYDVLSNLVNLKQQDLDNTTYVGKMEALKHEFSLLMPAPTSPADHEKQWDKFFMVLTLINLSPDRDTVKDQILGGSTVPTFDDVVNRLVRISSSRASNDNHTVPPVANSSALASHTGNKGGGSSGRNGGKNRPQCTHCNKLGHTRDRCWQLHGRPPRPVNFAQSETSDDTSSDTITLAGDDYKAFLKYQQAQASSVAASVAQTGNVTACLARSPDIGPWVLDSGASEHISGNKTLFTHLSRSSTLPFITIANGCKTAATGIGQAQILPSLSVDSVLYVPESPFNLLSVSKLTRSHNCSITFANRCVSIQDRSTGRMIGIGRVRRLVPSFTCYISCCMRIYLFSISSPQSPGTSKSFQTSQDGCLTFYFVFPPM